MAEETRASSDDAPPRDTREQDIPRRGTLIGPFLVLDLLGTGGMAIVVSAYDPALDRKVAIKLLRSHSAIRRVRLQREAQAMARLSHPNVVAVHQVGEYGDQTYLAMEHVDGETLGVWLRRPRPLREVLAAFVSAGRGLAAAHRAGLVHRDFKPDNVFVGKDGRVRVGDFGLAGPGSADSSSDDEAPSPGSALAKPLTETGVRLGTPAYMAPEQHDAGRVDARADQFAFCVALYEGLYGDLPFVGEDSAELAENARRGRFHPPPREAGPKWLHAIVLRGLSGDPAARFPSMDALVDALDRGPARVWRWVAPAATLAALVVGVVLAVGRGEGAACRDAAARLAGVWDPRVRADVEQRFQASGRSYAPQVFASVATTLDAYTSAWKRMRFDACEATAVRHEQSEALLDARMRCLDRRLGGLSALTTLLRQADAALVDRAALAVLALEPVDSCADATLVLAVVPPPRDPAARLRIEAVHVQLDKVAALERAGTPRPALPIAEDALVKAKELAYRPLEAEALVALGRIEMYTKDAAAAIARLEAALDAAAEVHDDPRVAQTLTQLIWLIGAKAGRNAEGLALRPAAEAAVRRAGGGEPLESQLYYTLGITYTATRLYAPALEAHERALALRERRDPDGLLTAKSLIGTGVALNGMRRLDEARTRLERALAIETRLLGADHLELAALLAELGTNAYYRHDLRGAEGHYRRSAEVLEKALGPNDPRVAAALNNVANAVADQDRLDEARAIYARALAIREQTLGPDHPEVAQTLTNIAELDAQAARYDEARAGFLRSIAISEAKLGPDSPAVAEALIPLGSMEQKRGRFEEARLALVRAVAIYDQAYGPGDPARGEPLAELVHDLVAMGRTAEAITTLERAMTALGDSGVASLRAQARFDLAQALVAAGQDRARAVAMAREASELYAAQGAAKEAERRAVDAWRARQ